MNILRLDALEDCLLIFTQHSVLYKKVLLDCGVVFEHLKTCSLQFTASRVEPGLGAYIIYGGDSKYLFDPYSLEIKSKLDIPSTSWYGGAGIEVTRLGTVKVGQSRFCLPEMPSNVIYTREHAIVQCGDHLVVVSASGSVEIADRLLMVTSGSIICEHCTYAMDGSIITETKSVAGVTQDAVVLYPSPGVLTIGDRQFDLETDEDVTLEYAAQLSHCVVFVVSPADLYVNCQFVEEFFTTRPIKQENKFLNGYRVILTENQLAFTVQQLPAEFEFYDGNAAAKDQYGSWRYLDNCTLIKRQTTYLMNYNGQTLVQIAGFQIQRKECYGFIGDQAIFKFDGQYYICQFQLLPNGFTVRNDYAINQEITFAKNDDFLPRIAIKRTGERYFVVQVPELYKNCDFSISDDCEVKNFHPIDTILQLSKTQFVIVPAEKTQKLSFYRIEGASVRLIDGNFGCEYCEYYQPGKVIILLNQQISLLSFVDYDVAQHVFDNFQVQALFRDQLGRIIVALVSTYGFDHNICVVVRPVHYMFFETGDKCIISVPVSKSTILHCSDQCFGYYMDGEYTVIPIVDYQEVFRTKQQNGQKFETLELERLLIKQPFLSSKFKIACSPLSCFCYSGQAIHIVECSSGADTSQLHLKQLRAEKLYKTGHLDVAGTIVAISPYYSGVCVLLTNMYLHYFRFSREQLQFVKLCDLSYYGIAGSDFGALTQTQGCIVVRCKVEQIAVRIVIDQQGSVECFYETSDLA